MSLRLSKIDDLSRSDHLSLVPDDECFFFGEYTPGAGYEKSGINSLIFNFKKSPDKKGKPEWKYKEKAITEIAEALQKLFTRVKRLKRATPVPIPPSETKESELYDDRMLRVLEKLKENLEENLDIRELIQQRESTQPDHITAHRQTKEELFDNYYIDSEFIR